MRRRLANLACRLLCRILPARSRAWGRAIQAEVDAIPDDRAALAFAIASAVGLGWRMLCHNFLCAWGALCPEDMMIDRAALLSRPRLLGLACAAAATGCGLVYMAMAGAPGGYLLVNAGAFAIGLCMLALLRPFDNARAFMASAPLLAASGLLATTWLGASAEGAMRWVTIGSLSIQPSLILVPPLILHFAARREASATLAIVLAAAALALQPDRAMAFMLYAGVTAVLIMRPDRHGLIAFLAGTVGLGAALLRADALPAVSFVDGILYSSFAVHWIAGLVVLAGSALLLAPAIAGRRDASPVLLAFGASWGAALVAAGVGNYPTPLVGYGGSAVLGYLLSIACLPPRAQTAIRGENKARPASEDVTGALRTLAV